jgi:hypothetical protein
MVENIKGTRDVPVETRNAFQGSSGSGSLQLPDRTAGAREPFPMYIEPSVEGMVLGF